MANTPNFSLYKPNRADNTVDVDTSLADNFTKIDTELQNNKGGLEAHINNANAHTSENVSHADGSVKTALENHEERLTAGELASADHETRISSNETELVDHETRVSSLETSTSGIDARVTDIEVLGIDKLAPNLEGRITTLESDIEGHLAPATFEALSQQNYTFDGLKMGYVDSKLADIATNVKSFGAKGDGTTDDTLAIQNALNSGNKEILVSSGNFKITSTLVIPSNVHLKLSKGTTLTTTSNINVIQLKRSAKLSGGTIQVNTVGYTKACVFLDGADNFGTTNHKTEVANIYLRGRTFSEGVGIHLYANGTTHLIDFVNFHDIGIYALDKAIFLEAIQPATGVAWVNGNTFNQVSIDSCRNGIIASGTNTDGNTFTNMQIQTSEYMDRCIKFDGGDNSFNGVLWDVQNVTGYAIELTALSFRNTIITSNINVTSPVLLDSGRWNKIESAFIPPADLGIYSNVAQAIPNNAYTDIDFNTVTFENGLQLQPDKSTVKFLKDGIYQVNFTIVFTQNNAGVRNLIMNYQGANWQDIYTNPTQNNKHYMSISRILKVTKDAVLSFQVAQTSGADLSVEKAFLDICKIKESMVF